jgi:hypothetical protein
MFSDSTCSGVSKISSLFFARTFGFNKSPQHDVRAQWALGLLGSRALGLSGSYGLLGLLGSLGSPAFGLMGSALGLIMCSWPQVLGLWAFGLMGSRSHDATLTLLWCYYKKLKQKLVNSLAPFQVPLRSNIPRSAHRGTLDSCDFFNQPVLLQQNIITRIFHQDIRRSKPLWNS